MYAPVYYAVQGGSNFWVCGYNPKVFPVALFIMLYRVVLTFESTDGILKSEHSNESFWAMLSCGAVYYAVQGGSNFESVDGILKCNHSNESFWAVFYCGTVKYAVWSGSNFWMFRYNRKMKAFEHF